MLVNSKHRGLTEKKPDEGMVEVAVYELVEMLDGSGDPYVLIDPPPVDGPISERLRVELAPFS
jgi:hypothetical protein